MVVSQCDLKRFVTLPSPYPETSGRVGFGMTMWIIKVGDSGFWIEAYSQNLQENKIIMLSFRTVRIAILPCTHK